MNAKRAAVQCQQNVWHDNYMNGPFYERERERYEEEISY